MSSIKKAAPQINLALARAGQVVAYGGRHYEVLSPCRVNTSTGATRIALRDVHLGIRRNLSFNPRALCYLIEDV